MRLSFTRSLLAVALCAVACQSGSTGNAPETDAGTAVDAGPAIDAGTSVDAGTAVDAGSACRQDSDCSTGVCDTNNGACVTSYCSPSCESWQSCAGRTCSLTAGRCDSDSDCSGATPSCNATHSCVAPPLTSPSTLHYSALIITNDTYQADFEQLAQLHTLTGVPTQVVTVSSICAAAPNGCNDSDTCNDTPKAIKDYLIAHQSDLQYVVLGGDQNAVPARATADAYSNSIYMVSFSETFYTDFYYADLSEWDTNANCLYGEPNVDTAAYLPNLGVTRISVSSEAELLSYLPKVTSYLTAYDTTNIQSSLFLSNVAAQIAVPYYGTVNVDSAVYFEIPGRTLGILPSDWEETELFSDLQTLSSSPLTVTAEQQAFSDGYNLVVHGGHGDPYDLTVELDGSNEFSGYDASQLQNTQYPIMLSCACQAAAFDTDDCYGGECAGQQFVNNPSGGGIGYLGNSATGLGLAGGSQLVDEFLRYTFTTSQPLVADAVMAAHANEPTSDNVDLSAVVDNLVSVMVPTIDSNSYRWTQKSATYLGDGLIPIYTDPTITSAPTFAATSAQIGSETTLTLTESATVAGTLAVQIGSDVYLLSFDGSSTTSTLTLASKPAQIVYGFSSATTLMSYQQVTVR